MKKIPSPYSVQGCIKVLINNELWFVLLRKVNLMKVNFYHIFVR